MTAAAAGPGPDPFAGTPPAGAGAACFGDVLAQLTVEADGDPQYRGLLFEPVAVEWLKRADPGTPLGTFTDPTRTGTPPTLGDIAAVYSWSEFAGNAKYRHLAPSGARDTGIDAVAEMKDGTLVAIQIKDGGDPLPQKAISEFIASATVDPGGVPRYAYQVLIYTNPDVHKMARGLLQGRHGGLVIEHPALAAAEPAGGWQTLLDNTAAQRSAVTRPTRTKSADGTPTPPKEIDGATPPEPLTWAQTISRAAGLSRWPELDDAAWLKDQYDTGRRTTADIAAELGCSPSAVCNALARHSIPARAARRRPVELDDAAWLKDQYDTGGRTTTDIAAELGCGPTAVCDALARHSIPARPGGPQRLGGWGLAVPASGPGLCGGGGEHGLLVAGGGGGGWGVELVAGGGGEGVVGDEFALGDPAEEVGGRLGGGGEVFDDP